METRISVRLRAPSSRSSSNQKTVESVRSLPPAASRELISTFQRPDGRRVAANELRSHRTLGSQVSGGAAAATASAVLSSRHAGSRHLTELLHHSALCWCWMMVFMWMNWTRPVAQQKCVDTNTDALFFCRLLEVIVETFKGNAETQELVLLWSRCFSEVTLIFLVCILVTRKLPSSEQLGGYVGFYLSDFCFLVVTKLRSP